MPLIKSTKLLEGKDVKIKKKHLTLTQGYSVLYKYTDLNICEVLK